MYFCFVSLFLVQLTIENLWITKLATRKKIGPTEYPRKTILDSRNNHQKKFLDPRNTHEKIFEPMKYPGGKGNIFGPVKNTHEKKFQTQNTREGTMALDPRWNVTHEI